MSLEKYTIYDGTEKVYKFLDIIEIFDAIHEDPHRLLFKVINKAHILINNNVVMNVRFICHRVNTLEQLATLTDQSYFGVELDVRDYTQKEHVHISHDPFHEGDDFEKYAAKYSEGKIKNNMIIVNVKSEQVEYKCIDILESCGIKNYMFLDSSFPMIYKLNKLPRVPRIACRFSEYEPIENFQLQSNFVSDVWVDCFTKFPMGDMDYSMFKFKGKNICIVSPELQGHSIEKIDEYKRSLVSNPYKKILCDYICCKIYNIIYWI